MSDQDSTKKIDSFNYISNELISYYNIVNGKDINHGKDIPGDTQSLLKSLKLLTKVLNEKPIDVK